MVSYNGATVAGTPTVEGARVIAKNLGDTKGKKITVFKYKNKTRYHRTLGHRSLLQRLRIDEIVAPGFAAKREKPEVTSKPSARKAARAKATTAAKVTAAPKSARAKTAETKATTKAATAPAKKKPASAQGKTAPSKAKTTKTRPTAKATTKTAKVKAPAGETKSNPKKSTATRKKAEPKDKK